MGGGTAARLPEGVMAADRDGEAGLGEMGSPLPPGEGRNGSAGVDIGVTKDDCCQHSRSIAELAAV